MSDDPRYRSGRWQKLRVSILRRAPLCRYCAARGRVEAATTVDHIVPTAGGGRFWDMANLAPACASCNYSKQDMSAEDFLAQGCGVDGYGGFHDERKNQTSLAAPDRMRPVLNTKLENEGEVAGPCQK